MNKTFEYLRVNHTTGEEELVYAIHDEFSPTVLDYTYKNKVTYNKKDKRDEYISMFITGKSHLLSKAWQ